MAGRYAGLQADGAGTVRNSDQESGIRGQGKERVFHLNP